MFSGDFETLAADAYRSAGFADGASAPAVLLAQRLLGSQAVRELPERVMVGTGALIRVGADWRIYVRRESPPHVKRFTVLHELAHYLLGRCGTEADCNRLAAALLLPRKAFLSSVRNPVEMPRHARAFGATETCAWMRLAETTEAPLIVVTPERVHVRGAAYSWPAEPVLRAAAERPRLRLPGLRKSRLRDDRSRLVLRVA